MTSHDVVAKLRGILGQKRVGHAGTLDPSATGVLLVGLGTTTRLLRFLQETTKCYEGSFQLGTTTTTLDADGEVVETFAMGHVTPAEVAAAAEGLTGEILQIPPMVSAIKIGGRRLHELAREGTTVERPARPVTVSAFEVTPGSEWDRYEFVVTCSSGTYVRSLVDDLGRALGGGAHLTSLRRSAVGAFGIAEALTIGEITARVTASSIAESGVVLSPAEALRALERVAVGDEECAAIATGRPLEHDALVVHGDGPFALVDSRGELVAVYRTGEDGRLVADVVLAAR